MEEEPKKVIVVGCPNIEKLTESQQDRFYKILLELFYEWQKEHTNNR